MGDGKLKPRWTNALGADLGAYAEAGIRHAEDNSAKMDQLLLLVKSQNLLLYRIAVALRADLSGLE